MEGRDRTAALLGAAYHIRRQRALLYLTSWRGVYAVDAESGKPWWDKNVEGTPSGYLTVEDNVLYAVIRQEDGAYLLALE